MNETGAAADWRSLLEPEPAPQAEPVGAAELASILAARMCHDFISPASAIVSGVDLLDDPSAQDMREDAMNLIVSSAKKLVAHLAFTRVAFGGSSSAETFDTRELEKLARGVFEHVRAELDWQVAPSAVSKPCARALLNLAQIGAGAAPRGGPADVFLVRYETGVIQVPVRRGENTGRTLPHAHVVRSLVRLGGWDGREVRFDLPAGDPKLGAAVIVQSAGTGPILTAAVAG